jgi:proteasome lid subunit RPN8/RPN11
MLHGLVNTASRLLNRLQRSLLGERAPLPEALAGAAPAAGALAAAVPTTYRRLERVVLTDEVSRTLFGDFASHRKTPRGREEIGWVLLGVREANEALVLATLPAGARRSAGIAHVEFNSTAQALASRIVRQADKRLTLVGVVHTHPGSLRHPSDGDYQGDSIWVGQLRGKEGVFGIGTADARPPRGPAVAHKPQNYVQVLGELCFHWYALGDGDRRYRPVPVDLTLGPDLARPLHPVWDMLETHALSLERLSRQQAGVKFDVVATNSGKALAVNVKLADGDSGLRLVLESDRVQYYLMREDDLIEVNPREPDVERAVYLILAELAGQK